MCDVGCNALSLRGVGEADFSVFEQKNQPATPSIPSALPLG